MPSRLIRPRGQVPTPPPIDRRDDRLRQGAMLLVAVLLGGCAVVEPQASEIPATPAPATAPTPAAAPSVAAVDAAGDFKEDILYKLLVAEFAGRGGDLDLALRNYLDVARETGSAEVAERAVRIAVFARNETLGLEAASLWREIAGANSEPQQVYAALLLRGGRIDEAVVELKRLVALIDDDSGLGFNTVSDLLARERNKQNAISAMEQVVAGHENDPNALFAFAHLLARSSQFERCLVTLALMREIAPGDERAVMFQARVMQQQGQTSQALQELVGYMELHPDNVEVRTTLARLLVDARRYEEARDQFERLAAEDPDNVEVRYALGLLLLQTNRVDEAETVFVALAADPERRDAANYYLGQIAEARADTAGAVAAYRKVSDGEHYLNAQLRVAVLMANEKRLEDARAHLHGLTPSNNQDLVRIVRTEAEILVREELLEEAMSVYDAALEEYPSSSDLLYARALLAERLDLLDAVERDLRAVLAREPNNADALNALGYTLADRTDRHAEALELIERALELKPDDHYILDSMGWVLYRLGRLQEAVDYLRKAMSIQDDPEVAAHLGEVLWVMGDHQGAREIWEAARRTTPDDKRLNEVIQRFEAQAN